MYYILILANFIGLLNASIPQLPTLNELTAQCLLNDPLHKMPELKKFLVDKDKTPFETFCSKNNNMANWVTVSMIKEWFQYELASRLNESRWVNSPFKPDTVNLSNAYYIGLNVPEGTKFYCWGDRHGDVRSLLEGLKTLKNEGIIGNDLVMQKGQIPVLLGDYLNNGAYSLEAAFTAMLLYIKNQNCIAIRGNHECTERPITQDWAIREATAKLKDELGEHAAREALLFFQLLEKLPVAAFVGIPHKENQWRHFLITHAAPDLGINPGELLQSLKNTHYEKILYCAIDPATYNRHLPDNAAAQAIINNPESQKNSPHLEKYLDVTRKSDARDLSFCRDQLVNKDPNVPFQYLHNITTLGWGLRLIEVLLEKDWGVLFIVRSHQHAHALDCKKDPSMFFPMHELWKARGASLAWQANSPDNKKLVQNDVVTVQVGPDSIYGLSEHTITGEPQTPEMYPGFSYDTIAILTVTGDGTVILTKKNIPVFEDTEIAKL
jgi:hypothetical protein